MDPTGLLAVALIFGGGTCFLLSISPIGRAIAHRIRGGTGGADERIRHLQDGQDALMEEVDVLRQDFAEIQERLDFAERLLAQKNEVAALPKSDDVQE